MVFSYDVTLEDLEKGSAGPLKPLLDAIEREWVGKDRFRASTVRCGTLYVYPTGNEGNGKVVLNLRFPLTVGPTGRFVKSPMDEGV